MRIVATGGSEAAFSCWSQLNRSAHLLLRPVQPSCAPGDGTADRHVPYHGGRDKLARWGFPVNDKPVSYAVSFWVEHNQCCRQPAVSANGNVEIARYRGGSSGAEVVVCKLSGGKHAWPGGRRAWFGADRPSPHLDATELVWNFFKSHPKR